jgi:predicted lipoprotein with Yx(FWY)xxD motif
VTQPGTATIASASSSLGSLAAYNPTGDPKAATYPTYAFSADTATASACTGLCARIWTPVLTSGAPQAASGVDQAALGTIQRPDGSTQVTYNGHPLYLFSPDFSGTDGQMLSAFGGTFQLMQASGMPSQTAPSERSVTAIPLLTDSASGTSASVMVAFTIKGSGRAIVLFGSGPGCSGLVETATQDTGAGTSSHTIVVGGNEMPGTVGNNGIQPGATYSFEVITVSSSGQEVDDNHGKCYTVTMPPA